MVKKRLDIEITEENKHLDKGYGLHKCDSCGTVTGNLDDKYGIHLCDNCKE